MSVVPLDVCGSFVLVFVQWFLRLPLFGRQLLSVVRLFERTKPLFLHHGNLFRSYGFSVFDAF
jgi:hypothetical protein